MMGSAPLVIAHRGASHVAPENTLAAFRLAHELGADAIEFDVKLTKDGEVVVLHDQTLDRTTSGSGALVEHTYAEIRRLDAGTLFGEEFSGELVPCLAEVLEQLGPKLLLNIELTNYAQPSDVLPESVLTLVEHFGLESRVLISSFNPLALWRTRRRSPEIPIALLLTPDEPVWMRVAFPRVTRHEILHPEQRMLSTELIRRTRQRGRRINVWTVNEREKIAAFIEAGVNGIITDRPSVARSVLGSWRSEG